jgi:hypothetical protein
MGEVLGQCFLCGVEVRKEQRRVVEVRRASGEIDRRLSCWRCWVHVMRPEWMSLVLDGEAVEARPSSLRIDLDLELGKERSG